MVQLWIWGRFARMHKLEASVLLHCNWAVHCVVLVAYNALCSYPLAKMEIGDSSQISTTAAIFSQYDYFRQTIWRLASVQFHF